MVIEDLWNFSGKKQVKEISVNISNLSIPTEKEINDSVNFYQNTEPEVKRPLNFNIVHTVKKVAKPLQQYVEKIDSNSNSKDDIVIGGSGAAYTQVKKFRRPHDLDLETSPLYMERVKHAVIRILSQKYQHITTRNLTMGKDGLKVIQILVNGRPAVDIKAHRSVGTILSVFDVGMYNHISTQPPIKIGKIFYTHINELFSKKAEALKHSYYGNKRLGKAIPERVKKDVRDFKTIQKSLSKGKKRKPEKFGTKEFWEL